MGIEKRYLILNYNNNPLESYLASKINDKCKKLNKRFYNEIIYRNNTELLIDITSLEYLFIKEFFKDYKMFYKIFSRIFIWFIYKFTELLLKCFDCLTILIIILILYEQKMRIKKISFLNPLFEKLNTKLWICFKIFFQYNILLINRYKVSNHDIKKISSQTKINFTILQFITFINNLLLLNKRKNSEKINYK